MPLADRIEVSVEDGRLARLVISNKWRDHGTPEELAQAISATIRDAMPPAAPATAAVPPPARAMSPGELRAYMEQHNDWHRRARDFRRRAAEGALVPDPAPVAAAEGDHVQLRFSQGRFESLKLNPAWAEKANIQTLVDEVLAAFADVDLVLHDPAAEERRALHRLHDSISEFASAVRR